MAVAFLVAHVIGFLPVRNTNLLGLVLFVVIGLGVAVTVLYLNGELDDKIKKIKDKIGDK